MTCAGCVKTLERHLLGFSSIVGIKTSLITNKTIVTFDQNRITAATIVEEIDHLNFKAEVLPDASVSAFKLVLEGVDQEKFLKAEKFLQKLEGIIAVESPSQKERILAVQYDAEITGPRSIRKKLKEIEVEGNLVPPSSVQENADSELKKWLRLLVISSILCIPVILIAFIFPEIDSVNKGLEKTIQGNMTWRVFIQFLLSTPIQLFIGWPIYTSAWKALYYARVPDMNCLIVLR
jgi:cation transport ATPase